MKNLLLILFSTFCLTSSAQIVSGIYMGKLVNDSTKKVQTYELALSEYRGKISGYSYTTFVSNDTFYYSIKKIKATRKGDQLIVQDDKMIVNNFPESPAKGVRQINYIKLTGEDTLRQAIGNWETTRTKIYYSLQGNMEMLRNSDSSGSALIGHLKELNIIGNNNYQYTATTNERIARNDKTSTKNSESKNMDSKNPGTKAADTKTDDRTVAETKVKVKVKDDKVKIKEERKKAEPVNVQGDPVATTRDGQNKTTSISGRANANAQPVVLAPRAQAVYTERKNKMLQAVEVDADSLVLAFYDNGVIDGDSISVYVNGQNIISNNRLTATATKKTIAIPSTGEVRIVLVAENMGTIPPNTGLLMVNDGTRNHQVFFSADLQTNAEIILRRKKN